MNFSVFQASRIGGRKYNQDRVAYAYSNEALLLVLADGMGGHQHGEIAAQAAIHVYMQAFAQVAKPRIPNPEIFLREVMKNAHHTIIQYARDHKLGGNPGTTCVAAVVQEGQIWWAHAGDSRLYLIRDQQATPLTHDHSMVQQWADWGIISQEETKVHPDRNKITNCLGGVEEMFYVESSPGSLPLADGDELLLCSDGLWSPLEDPEIAAAMSQAPLQAALEQLMTEAIYRDGASADNTTVVAARIGNSEQAHSTDMPMCMVLDYR
jgi:serine/threonine protein phosphatase PrpC